MRSYLFREPKHKTNKQTTKWKLLFMALMAAGLLTISACTSDQTAIETNNTDPEAASSSPTVSDRQTESEESQSGTGQTTDATSHTADPTMSTSQAAGPYIKIAPEEAKAWLESENAPLLVDVRTPEEYAAGHIEGALLFPVGDLQHQLSQLPIEKDEPLILYCRSGNRTLAAADILISAGFTQVYDLGGIIDWPYETVTD